MIHTINIINNKLNILLLVYYKNFILIEGQTKFKYIILKDGRLIFQNSNVTLFLHKFGTRTGRAHDLQWIN